MSEEGLNSIVELITASYRDGHLLSLTGIRSMIIEKKGITILKDPLDHVLDRDGRVRTVTAVAISFFG
jgi:hypothetical protein